MKNSDFNTDKIVQFWIDSSNEDFITMLTLYENKIF